MQDTLFSKQQGSSYYVTIINKACVLERTFSWESL